MAPKPMLGRLVSAVTLEVAGLTIIRALAADVLIALLYGHSLYSDAKGMW